MLATMATTTKPNPNGLTRWKKQAVRYQFLRLLMIWVKARPGIGSPTIRGFHQVIGGKKRISWTRFKRDHYDKLVGEGYLDYSPDDETRVCALIITNKAWEEVEI